jgi:hypothetical protein
MINSKRFKLIIIKSKNIIGIANSLAISIRPYIYGLLMAELTQYHLTAKNNDAQEEN